MTKFIDADNLIVGRMATQIAKMALGGENVVIVNCEKAVMTGARKTILDKAKHARKRVHPYHGPFMQRMPDRMVKRMIRGMLPHKKERGILALKKVRCFVGVPENFVNENFETLPLASIEKLKTHNFLTIKEISKELGAKL